MIKKELYPKTKRIQHNQMIQITEKIDGENTAIFKYKGTLYVARRKNIFTKDEIAGNCSKNFDAWFNKHVQKLEESINEGSVICCEWMEAGVLKYPENCPIHKNELYMFGKANVAENEDGLYLYNFKYEHDLFKYCFVGQEIPEFIHEVPCVDTLEYVNVQLLDELYDNYTALVKRPVEGFVVNFGDGIIKKYVRMKRGKLEPHED